MKTPMLVALATLSFIAPLSLAAKAGDVQGDAYSCEELWVMRNQMYKDNAFCFQSTRAMTYFGNGGCIYHDDDAVPFSKSERRVLHMIKASEARQGC